MIHLQKNGVSKFIPTGFSWTTLIFGLFVPLVRGDLKWATIMFVLGLLSCGLSWFIIPFFYNNIYIDNLKINGWTEVIVNNTQSNNIEVNNKIEANNDEVNTIEANGIQPSNNEINNGENK